MLRTAELKSTLPPKTDAKYDENESTPPPNAHKIVEYDEDAPSKPPHEHDYDEYEKVDEDAPTTHEHEFDEENENGMLYK